MTARFPPKLSLALFVTALVVGTSAPAEVSFWQAGLARANITPQAPIRMAGFAARQTPSEGVAADLHVKVMALEDGHGRTSLLITADLIGFSSALAEEICSQIRRRADIPRARILLAPSHTHAGPVLGGPRSRESVVSANISEEQQKVIDAYTEDLVARIADAAVAALADLKPARLSWGVGVARFVMNRRELVPGQGVRLGVNPQGYVDRSVPVLRVEGLDGRLRALVFGCACHNTTLSGQNLQVCGDYAGFAQEAIERQRSGAQAMFILGCAGDAGPHPKGTMEIAKQHGRDLAAEVCRVANGSLRPVRGPLRTELDWVDLPLAPVPSIERLEQMRKGPPYLVPNATRMIEALRARKPLPTRYRAPLAVWQFGVDLTLVGVSGEVVSDYVPLIQKAIGSDRLWIAGYVNDYFGYLPSRKVLEEGGYETRGLFEEPGFVAPEVEPVVVNKVAELAKKAGRKN